jgi:hypothetical protein
MFKKDTQLKVSLKIHGSAMAPFLSLNSGIEKHKFLSMNEKKFKMNQKILKIIKSLLKRQRSHSEKGRLWKRFANQKRVD